MKSVLTLILLVLMGAGARAAEPGPIVVVAQPDGAFMVEGARYTDGKALVAKLPEIAHRRPTPVVSFAVKDTHQLMQLITMFQKAGVPKIGFIIQPNSN